MSILYYLIFLGLLLLLIEVLSMIFKVTGLETEKARFQVISILTHTGFTTRESELIAQHPLRRKIAGYLMLFSYVAQAGLISIFLNIITNRKNPLDFLIIVLAIAAAFIIMGKNRSMLSKFDIFLEKYITRQIRLNKKRRTLEEVLKLNPDFGVYEILLEERNTLCGKTLREARLKDRYIQILNVHRGSHSIDFPTAGFELKPADRIVVYGRIDSITQLMLEQK